MRTLAPLGARCALVPLQAADQPGDTRIATWTQAVVRQGDASATIAVADGRLRFRAEPHGGPVELTAP